MRRYLSILLSCLLSVAGLMAQSGLEGFVEIPVQIPVVGEMHVSLDADSAALDPAAVDSVAPLLAQQEAERVRLAAEQRHLSQLQRALYRSWRRTHPVQTQPLRDPLPEALPASLDSLLGVLHHTLQAQPGLSTDMQYLYDMRLPVISSGSVPADLNLGVGQLVQRDENRAERVTLPVPYFDDTYRRQLLNEQQRHNARYIYASSDPRRFHFVRRKFEVPNYDHIFDSQSTLNGMTLIDDIDINFGDANLESFGHDFSVHADRWHWKGDHSFTMQQTALTTNWYSGGDNNMSISSDQRLTVSRYDEQSKVTFEGVFQLKLAGYYTKADTIHRMRVSDNEFNLNLKYGYKAWKKWYYSAQLYAKTPVFDFYNANSRTCKNTFLSPLEMNLAFGVDYQYSSPSKRFTYSLLLAPLSYDMKYVRDSRINPLSYQIKEGKQSVHNFGSTVTTKFDWKMSQNASWSSRLYYFTTYHQLKVEFENTFNFKISRFFTARAYFYPRFDDNIDTEVEGKEMLTIGFSYAW